MPCASIPLVWSADATGRRGRLRIGQSVPVATTGAERERSDDAALLALFRAIASRDDREVARRLEGSLDLAIRPIRIAASRELLGTG